MYINNFNNWLTSIKEAEIQSEPKVTEPTVSVVHDDSQKSEIISDVDNIINSLETLASELTEELSQIRNIDFKNIDEATLDKASDFINSWIISIKAAKAQKKVNKIKMNTVDLEFAAEHATGDKKKILNDKLTKTKQQAKELQSMVDDKFKGKGGIVDSRLAKEKIRGQLELIKRTTGMEDNPKTKADLKTKIKELQVRAAEEEKAIAELEGKNQEVIKKEKEKLSKNPKKEESNGSDKISEIESNIKIINSRIEDARKSIIDKTKELEKEQKDVKTGRGSEEKVLKIKKQIEDEKEDITELSKEEKSLKNKLSKMSTKESLYNRANLVGLNELVIEINSKADWQIQEGTALNLKYENLIKNAELNSILNESKYQNTSIKDKFLKLI